MLDVVYLPVSIGMLCAVAACLLAGLSFLYFKDLGLNRQILITQALAKEMANIPLSPEWEAHVAHKYAQGLSTEQSKKYLALFAECGNAVEALGQLYADELNRWKN